MKSGRVSVEDEVRICKPVKVTRGVLLTNNLSQPI